MIDLPSLEYIVNEIVRRRGDLPPRFTQNVRRNVRRKFKVSVSAEEVDGLIPLYRGMYRVAADEIRRTLDSRSTPPLDEADRLATRFGAFLSSRYPKQPATIRRMVAGWAVYYEIYR